MFRSEVEDDDTSGTRSKGPHNVLHDSFHHRALKRVVHVENKRAFGKRILPGVHLYELDFSAPLFPLRPAPYVVLRDAIERRGKFDSHDFLKWQEGCPQDRTSLAGSEVNEQEFLIRNGESFQQLP